MKRTIGHVLYDWVSIPGRGEELFFSLLPFPWCYDVHPASYIMETRALHLGIK
jgi:hypothetical protein